MLYKSLRSRPEEPGFTTTYCTIIPRFFTLCFFKKKHLIQFVLISSPGFPSHCGMCVIIVLVINVWQITPSLTYQRNSCPLQRIHQRAVINFHSLRNSYFWSMKKYHREKNRRWEVEEGGLELGGGDHTNG